MRYGTAIFDMDGTILDTLEDICDALNDILREFGFPELPLPTVRRYVGDGLRNLVGRSVPPDTDDGIKEKFCERFIPYYRERCMIKTKPYPGVREMIRDLRMQGIKTAVVSNKLDAAVKALCEQLFDGLFDVAIGSRDGFRNKPAPDSVFEAIRLIGAEKSDCVYIGDSDIDIATAKNAGLDMIIVEWGFRDRELLIESGAPFTVSSPEQVRELVLNGKK